MRSEESESLQSPGGPYTDRLKMKGKTYALLFALVMALIAGAAANAGAYYNVTIGASSTAGSWSGTVWSPNGTK